LATHCGIEGPQTLPYSYQIVLLADVLWHHKSDIKSLNGPLTEWLWITTYGEYFASMTSSRIRLALEHLHKVAAGKAEPRPPDLSNEIAPPGRFDFRAARSRVMALTMADKKPVSPLKKPYNAYAILAKYGRDALPKLLSSKEVGGPASERFENRFVTTPRDSKALRYALLTPGKLSRGQLESHGITKAAATALHKKSYDTFLRLRRAYFLGIERKFVEEELGLSYVTGE
jgi:hypothetical protein